MQRKTSNESFEQFLRQNADEFKIYPSSKAWDGITKKMNRGKRYYFTFSALLLTASVISFLLFNDTFFASHKTALAEASVSTQQPAVLITQPQEKNRNNERAQKKTTPLLSTPLLLKITGFEKLNPVRVEEENFLPVIPGSSLQPMNGLASLISPKPISNVPLNKVAANYSSFDFTNLIIEQKKDSIAQNSIAKKAARKKNKVNTMFFITPTISYRKLSENKSYLHSGMYNTLYTYSSISNINKLVTHKPDIGLEFGFATKYALTKNIKLRGGLQFNINRYDIKAFNSYYQVATIALNNGYRVDSVSTFTNHRNYNGANTDWLENLYFQIAAPIGLEVKISGNDKTQFGIASTLQPTYVLGDKAYLITSDYKNYAKVPWLTRRWNVNTSVETFVSFTNGRVKWQVGPQVRYQLLSSFIHEYPVKENLFDFGLKVGVSVNPH